MEIDFAALAAQGDEADSDGTVDGFVVQSLASGTLRIGTNSASATPWAAGSNKGILVFSWEIPQSFDDIETLLAIVDVTDDISAKTELFKFQVYCLPIEQNCKVEGN